MRNGCRLKRSFLGPITVLTCLMICLPTFAQAPEASGTENSSSGATKQADTVSLEIKDTPLKQVLEMLFRGASELYLLDPALDRPPYDKITVSLTLRDVPFEEALKSLLKAHHLVYRVENSTYIISPAPETPPAAGAAPAAAPGATSKPPLITLEFKNTPVRIALDSLFKGTGLNYAIDADVQGIVPQLSMKNVAFDQALKTLAHVAGLVYRKEGGMYIIASKRSIQPPAAESGMQDLVTTVIMPMPIKEALARLDSTNPVAAPKWQFDDNLGAANMPGAKFYKFPRRMAEQLLLAASGLIPPRGNDRHVKAAGKVDPSSLFSWIMQNSDNVGGEGGAGGYGGPPGLPPAGGQAAPVESPVSIGAYRAQDRWVFTILANQAPDAELLDKLFAISGTSYVIGGRGRLGGARVVSARLYGVTLDQALDALLPSLGLTFRKPGDMARPTYIIADTGTGLQPPRPITGTRKPR